MAGVLELVRDWAAQLPYWEQAALERVASGAPITEKDYEGLLDLCLQDGGLIPVPVGSRPTLAFPTRLDDKSDTAGCVVERLFNLRNVNALPEAQEITFGPQLTAVYGPNGSGKRVTLVRLDALLSPEANAKCSRLGVIVGAAMAASHVSSPCGFQNCSGVPRRSASQLSFACDADLDGHQEAITFGLSFLRA